MDITLTSDIISGLTIPVVIDYKLTPPFLLPFPFYQEGEVEKINTFKIIMYTIFGT